MCSEKHEKRYNLTCSLDCFATDLFNELNQKEGFSVKKIPAQGKYIFTVEKQMRELIKLVRCNYEITIFQNQTSCIMEFKNLDTEPVFQKYIKAFFVPGIGLLKIVNVYEELQEVSQFPDYIDSIVRDILKR